jgi:hypothetical protein
LSNPIFRIFEFFEKKLKKTTSSHTVLHTVDHNSDRVAEYLKSLFALSAAHTLTIAAPRLRPLFKDKQIVEGSDGCGLFVDN